jgi:hypothetical protein
MQAERAELYFRQGGSDKVYHLQYKFIPLSQYRLIVQDLRKRHRTEVFPRSREAASLGSCTALQEICLRVGFAADIRLRRQRNPGWQNFVGAPIATLPL